MDVRIKNLETRIISSPTLRNSSIVRSWKFQLFFGRNVKNIRISIRSLKILLISLSTCNIIIYLMQNYELTSDLVYNSYVMKIKHLQLNTNLMKSPKKIVDFIESKSFDVACLQEIGYPIGGENPLRKLLEDKGYHYAEGLHFKYLPNDQNLGVAIVSKFPIVDIIRVYWNSKDHDVKEIDDDDFLGSNIIEDEEKSKEFPGSRGVRHSAKSRCILMCLVDCPEGKIRVVTTHFTVTDLCTETKQMFDIACLTASLIKNARNFPTLFSADLNIRAKSFSVSKIREALTCHTLDIKDTLSDEHVAKEKDFPEGLAIDHVFSKGLDYKSTKTEEIDFSVHKAVVSEFGI